MPPRRCLAICFIWVASAFAGSGDARADGPCTIGTVVGNPKVFCEDGGPATAATLFGASRIARDSAGNLFIADSGNHRVRRISPAGIISTYAGNGSAVFSGDGGLATEAGLPSPRWMAIGPDNKLYVLSRSRIRKIRTDAVIDTVARTGQEGSSVDGGLGLAVDSSGVIYFSSSGGSLHWGIRRVRLDGSIETFAGPGGIVEANDLRPHSLAVAPDDSVYFFDQSTRRVRRVTLEGVLEDVAGNGGIGALRDGPALETPLYFPGALAFDAAGDLLMADHGAIRRVREGRLETVHVAPYILDFLPEPDGGSTVLDEFDRVSRITREGAVEHVAGFNAGPSR